MAYSRVLVALLGEGIELGNSIVESLLGEVAGTVWRVEDLVVEDREVEGETKADRMCRRQICLGNLGGLLVRLVSGLGGTCSRISDLEVVAMQLLCLPFLESPAANSARYRW